MDCKHLEMCIIFRAICLTAFKKKHICVKYENECICSVAVYGSETWTLGKNPEKVINAFETWCWRRMLKIKWTDRITNEEIFSKGERRKITFKN